MSAETDNLVVERIATAIAVALHTGATVESYPVPDEPDGDRRGFRCALTRRWSVGGWRG